MASRREQGTTCVFVPALRGRELRDLVEEGRGVGRLAALGGDHGQGKGSGHELGPARQRRLRQVVRLGERVLTGQQELQKSRGTDPVVRVQRRERPQLPQRGRDVAASEGILDGRAARGELAHGIGLGASIPVEEWIASRLWVVERKHQRHAHGIGAAAGNANLDV